jgi:hypothetical protein
MKIERVSLLRNIERLAKIIFINFISLENQPVPVITLRNKDYNLLIYYND